LIIYLNNFLFIDFFFFFFYLKKIRLGFTESQLVKDMYDGVREFIKEEKKLGESIRAK
jgi:hypothetical protein